MRKLLPFLACLMLVLTSWSGMAHAAETAGGSIAGVEFTVHAAGDGDEVPADADNGLPHHHGTCHGHDVSTPSIAGEPPLHRIERGERGAITDAGLVSVVLPVTPRPPKA